MTLYQKKKNAASLLWHSLGLSARQPLRIYQWQTCTYFQPCQGSSVAKVTTESNLGCSASFILLFLSSLLSCSIQWRNPGRDPFCPIQNIHPPIYIRGWCCRWRFVFLLSQALAIVTRSPCQDSKWWCPFKLCRSVNYFHIYHSLVFCLTLPANLKQWCYDMVVILFNKLTSLHMPKSRHVLGVVFCVTIAQYSKQESQESKVIHRSDILRTFIPRFILALRFWLSEVACDC